MWFLGSSNARALADAREQRQTVAEQLDEVREDMRLLQLEHDEVTEDLEALRQQFAEASQQKARLLADVASLAQEVPRLQQEYIERLRQKEALVKDIASVNAQLRAIALDHAVRKPDTVYIDAEDDMDAVADVPLAQRMALKRSVPTKASSVIETETENAKRAKPAASNKYTTPTKSLGNDVFFSVFTGRTGAPMVDIRKWLVDGNKKPVTPMSARFHRGSDDGVGVCLSPEAFKKAVQDTGVDAALAAKQGYGVQLDGGLRVMVAAGGGEQDMNVTLDNRGNSLRLTAEQWGALKACA